MAISINKTLYVGVGGTGAKTLAKIKRHFIDSYGEIPQPMIGFLAIDTQDGIGNIAVAKSGADANGVTYTVQGGRVTDVKEIKSRDVRLAANEIKCVSVQDALTIYRNQESEFSWMPKPPKGNVGVLSSIKSTGAGQVRSSGCFIARYNHIDIEASIYQAINRISAPLPPESRYQLGKGKTAGIPSRTTINVICSMSGGTGAGMLIDVLMMIQNAEKKSGMKCDVIPWVVMPDIYKQITPTSSFNVFYNTYGTLRDLDFIFQNCKEKTIPFGDGSIAGDPPFKFAYLINNVSSSGNAFSNLDDLLDCVAKCAFLPSGDMGTAADEMKDNIESNQESFSISTKKAWTNSLGAAELIYDSDTVGIATAYAVAERLANKLVNTNQVGSALCDNFVDREDVKIRENGGHMHDDVTDAIYDLGTIRPFEVEKGTEADDIVNRVNIAGSDATPEANFANKLANTKQKLEGEIQKQICDPAGGGLATAAAFLTALDALCDTCLCEMTSEGKELENKLRETPDWIKEVDECHGIFGRFLSDEAESLSDVVNGRIRDIMDLRRHKLAARFYTELKEDVAQYKALIDAKVETVRQIGGAFDSEVVKLQNSCKPKSKFQVYLHIDALSRVNPGVTQQMWNDFCESGALPKPGNLTEWLKETPAETSSKIMRFAGGTSPVSAALSKGIEDVLGEMDSDTMIRYTKYVLDMATPLWTVDFQGRTHLKINLSRQVLVGVPNQEGTIMKNSDVTTALTYGTTGPKYASTGQRDRVYIMVVESSVPVFAVNNFRVYENEYKERIEEPTGLSCSIDAGMDSLREAMNFSLWPTEKPALSLEMWTQAFCFASADGQHIVRYDKEANQYWMVSKTFGNPIKGYRYDLGQQRDVAFKQFETGKLYEDVQNAIKEIVTANGSRFVSDTLDSMRGTGNTKYFDNCVIPNMSPAEEDGIRNGNPLYKGIEELVQKEINLRTNKK